MERHSIDAIVKPLNTANVRYLVAGELAVVAHGYVRFTADIDLIVDLEPANVTRAVTALERLGYRPRAPVAFGEFADPQKRTQWARDKNLTVFSVYSPQHPLTEIDLFVDPPLDFEAAYRSAVRKEVAPGVAATFIGIGDLPRLKERAVWERGWDGHETQQRERWSRLPLSEKLRWLEEAHHLVLHLSSVATTSAAPADDNGGVAKSSR